MQTEKELQEAEARRQAFIRAQQTNAKDWWDSGRTYFIVKLNLGGTLASWTKGQTTHEGDDASGALQGHRGGRLATGSHRLCLPTPERASSSHRRIGDGWQRRRYLHVPTP